MPVRRVYSPRGATERAAALRLARQAAIDVPYLRRVVDHLSSIGSSDLGFRVAGTPEDHAVAAFVAEQLDEIGLSGVAVEHVAVDGWRFHGADLAVAGATYQAASLGGVPPTPADGVTGPLIDVGTASRRELDRLEVAGRIALVDWRSATVSPSDVGLELGLRGARGIVLSCPVGGPHYGSEGALGSFNSRWHEGAPPLVTIRKEDAATIRAGLDGSAPEARLTLAASFPPLPGANVVGQLPGQRGGMPIVVGAHHDGWFRAAFDNATGVAALLAMARGMVAAGYRPRHPICFTSRTGEEYGVRHSAFDWCVGAWQQVASTHPRWGAGVPFHLCLEASGHPGLRTILQTPPELRRWLRGAARIGSEEGWLTSGWRVTPPVTGTEQWPFLVSGIPGVATFGWESSFARTDYHTQLDTPDLVDFEHLGRQTRFYTFLLADADCDPDAILDHAARAREVARIGRGLGASGERLERAAELHASARGRRAFTRVGRGLHAVRSDGTTDYPHAQACRDAALLAGALAALACDDRGAAIRALAAVGDNRQARRLSEEAFAIRLLRRQPRGAGATWASRSHLTATPNLWRELATLRAEPGSRAMGPWLERSLRRHQAHLHAEVARRISAMERALAGPASGGAS